MSTAAGSDADSLADLVHRLGDIPLGRIRLRPPPGTARERDVVAAPDRENVPCELADSVLVEKAVGFLESCLTGELLGALGNFVARHG